MKQVLLLSGLVAGIGCGELSASVPAKEKKAPNVVFIIADDLGYGELSCYGQEKFQTPNIDRLALEGMRYAMLFGNYGECAFPCLFNDGLAFWPCSYTW